MRKTRARALSAGWRSAGLAATLALCACSGLDVISLGGTPSSSMERFLSPTGDDGNPGSTDSPWKTFPFALAHLDPGWTLTLLPGTYEAATTKTLNVRCAETTAGSTVLDATPAKSGTPDQPITVRAYPERQAFVRGDGKVPPISIDSCQNWEVQGLHVESLDVDDPQARPDSGSVVVLDGPNDHVVISKLLALHPNHNEHAQVIRIGDGASDVTVEQCELYDFHESGIEARRSEQLVIEQNYVNARQSAAGADKTRPLDPEDGPLGTIGVRLEETRVVYALNNIVEDVDIGFAVLGRGTEAPAGATAMQINLNVLRGNIVYEPANIGFRIDSQCGFANPCDTAHMVVGTELSNDVVYRGALGVDDAGSIGTTIDKLSVLEALRGVLVSREPQNAGLAPTFTATSTLVSRFQSVGFFVSDSEMTWSISHCDVAGGYSSTGLYLYQPDDGNVMDKVTTTPDLGNCIAYIPMLSHLRTGAANDVGANVIYEYDETGQLTATPLWKPSFVGCGNIVPGFNDESLPSCTSVNVRLMAADPIRCPLPASGSSP